MKIVSLADLPRVIEREQKHVRTAVTRAIGRTATAGARVVRRRVPKAFEDLADSVHATDAAIVVDAPHAAAVEIGSRPHMPPLEPLIRWARLRATQALTPRGRLTRRRGVDPQIARVGRQVRELEIRTRKGRHNPVDTIEQIARRIQHAIAAHGTKPRWYARQSLPEVIEILDANVKKEIVK